jgi:Lrp/AsnC family transcriptional regulator, leucine-responsive regulatory protein
MKRRAVQSLRLDRIDLKILRALQDNSRITNKQLAEKVALSPSACLARVRQLEEAGFIVGYHAHIDATRVRPTLQMIAEIAVKQHSPEKLDAFDKALRKFPQVIEAARVSGPYDYIIQLVVADMREWRTLADTILKLELGVEKMTTHVIVNEVKPFVGYPLT